MSIDKDFDDIPLSWLKQELFVAQRILAKISYYPSGEEARARLSEFYSKYFPPPSSLGEAYDTLGRISEVLKKFQNFELIYDLQYGESAMQSTVVFFSISADKLRLYKAILLKEIRLREGEDNVSDENRDILINGNLSYNIDNREVKYGNKPAIGLDSSADYGRFFILLISNIDKRVTYTQICDAIGRDYKGEGIDPEKESSIRREIQQIKKDLLNRLRKTGISKKVLKNLIVSRDGYKMNNIT